MTTTPNTLPPKDPSTKNENSSISLAEFIRAARLNAGLSVVTVARACGLSKQYLCDIEHGRRGMRLDTVTAARLATCLEIPIVEITNRAERLSNRERRQYSEYHRVLRSNTRAEQALAHMNSLRSLAGDLKIALNTGRDARKLVQLLENTISELDTTLAYRAPRPKRWAQVEGDDAKLAPGRRAIDWTKVG